ncbi:hypothetical protein Goari_006686 [Gossypium aridum]|uniref:DUF7745 domain-containing protein n=2 Tax=Gossypium aridum TaxID=34290 RepID=A0A7J8XNQ2_GOSAI|nr:hypothetical protein [Gossypium aridum]
MEKGFLDKVEDNATVRIWPEKIQQKKGDSLTEGYVSELWDFTRTSVYLVPTVEECTTLLCCPRIQADKAYSRAVSILTFLNKLMSITGMSDQWVATRIKLKGDRKCIPWKSLRDLILEHPDTKKRVNVFTLRIYGLVIFPKALWHIDEAVLDLFDRLDKRVTPVSTILAKTFRSLSASWRGGEGRFIKCAQLLLPLFHSHFWKVEKVSYRVCSENYSPLKEFVATPRRDNIFKEKWMVILQSLQEEDVLYRCGDFDWVSLLGIWKAIGYAPLFVLRQYRLKQFISTTQGLAQCEFAYKGDNYKKKVREISNAWNRTHKMKGLATNPMTTPEYDWW